MNKVRAIARRGSNVLPSDKKAALAIFRNYLRIRGFQLAAFVACAVVLEIHQDTFDGWSYKAFKAVVYFKIAVVGLQIFVGSKLRILAQDNNQTAEKLSREQGSALTVISCVSSISAVLAILIATTSSAFDDSDSCTFCDDKQSTDDLNFVKDFGKVFIVLIILDFLLSAAGTVCSTHVQNIVKFGLRRDECSAQPSSNGTYEGGISTITRVQPLTQPVQERFAYPMPAFPNVNSPFNLQHPGNVPYSFHQRRVVPSAPQRNEAFSPSPTFGTAFGAFSPAPQQESYGGFPPPFGSSEPVYPPPPPQYPNLPPLPTYDEVIRKK